jgi:adenosylcobinamide kinase/adenosylcobinamide-phosphate guanylyltransferase
VETLDVGGLLETAVADDVVLVDCLALWLAGQLDRARVWDVDPGTAGQIEALAAVERETARLAQAIRTTAARVVVVSNEVGSGVVPEHASGRVYRDLLGRLNAQVAAQCDEVALVVAGRVLTL